MVDGHGRKARIGLVSRMLAAAGMKGPVKLAPPSPELLDAITAGREAIMRQRREVLPDVMRADVMRRQPPPGDVEALMDEIADKATARLAAAESEPETSFPPGVLGYGVAVYPGGGPHCTGLTHTGLMTLDSARREAKGHAKQARTDPSSAWHEGVEYRVVEIREAGGG